MDSNAKLPRLVLTSPWFFLLFLIIPISVVLTLRFHVALPFLSPIALLANNIALAVLVLIRLVYYLFGLSRKIKYGAKCGRPASGFGSLLGVSDASGKLARAGFAVADGGRYAEKVGFGYLGTVILYAGLLVVLSVGSWDNLRKFSGVVLDGVGPSTNLSKLESYRSAFLGPLAEKPDKLPMMRILSQTLPGPTKPKGATEIALISRDGVPTTYHLEPTTPIRVGDYDLYMAKLVYEAQLVIKTKDSKTLFDQMVRLDPLVQKRGEFGFYGLFVGQGIIGGVYYDPDRSQMMVVVTRNGKRIVTDLRFQVDQQITAGDYVISCEKLGQWSEIHVVRHRNQNLIWLGGIVALIGLGLRLAFRPQRVWLEEAPDGCRLFARGGEAKKVLG